MYTRVMTQKNKDGTTREYLCLLESYREGGKSKQRMVANLGRMGVDITPEKIDKLLLHLEKFAGKVQLTNILKDLKSKASKTYGEIEIFRKVWKTLGIETILKNQLAGTEKQINYVEALFAATCNRLQDPMSKKGTSEWMESVYQPQWKGLELHHIYRGMDFLIDRKDAIEGALFDQARDLFNSKVNVAMFDTTTVSYWGKGEDPIFQRGHAKNKRFDLKQLVVGIVMDQDGTPLGHEVWPGNMNDRPAFKAIITKIKQKFMIEKVILVCDKGMVSESNLAFLESEGYEYVLSMKLRQLSAIRQRILLGNEGFRPVGDGMRQTKEMQESQLWHAEELEKRAIKIANGINPAPLDPSEIATYADTLKGKRRWVICLNQNLAREDRENREYFRKILENKVEFRTAKEWIIKNGYKKYVKISEFSIELDRAQFELDEIYDGKWALITNTSLPAESLVRTYKDLAQIEQHFRTLKSDIKLGPVFHWTQRRVRAHVFICFLALQIRTFISKKIKDIQPDLSYADVMRDVAAIRANFYEFKGNAYIQRTEFSGLAHIAFKATSTRVPPEFLSLSAIPISN